MGNGGAAQDSAVSRWPEDLLCRSVGLLADRQLPTSMSMPLLNVSPSVLAVDASVMYCA